VIVLGGGPVREFSKPVLRVSDRERLHSHNSS
jgi:hypothetical protein